jgi:hypothetical protein
MKLSLALAGAILLGGTLAACGGSDDGGGAGGDYCKDLKSATSEFKTLESGDYARFDTVVTTIHKLAGEAPGDIKDDWEVLDGALSTIVKAFDDAGIKLSDLDDIQAGKIPEGVDMSKLAGLSTTLGDVSSEKYTDASKNIEKHAKDVCKVDLSDS